VIAVDATHCPCCGTALGSVDRDGRERRHCPDCDRVVWRTPVPGANALVVDRSTDPLRGLLVERANPPQAGSWTVPGGLLEHDESPAACAVRELREETGVRVDAADLDPVDTALGHRAERTSAIVLFAVDRALTEGGVRAGSDAAAARFRSLAGVERAGDDLRYPHGETIRSVLG